MDLNTAWYFLIGVLFAGYAVLDGFDLGVGVLSLFSRDEKERDIYMSAIAPVWDGNEVWLLAGGGALFAAFPRVYATIFSGFYLALMFVLCALILRAVSLEFRAHIISSFGRTVWGWVFGTSSLLVSILLGVAFGNILRGVPIAESGTYTGSFFGLLNPFALLMGLLSMTFFVLHGAVYMTLKTEGEFQQRMYRWSGKLIIAEVVVYVLVLAALGFVSPFLFSGRALFLVTIPLTLVGFGFVWSGVRRSKGLQAFAGSALSIIGVTATSGFGLYPKLAPSITNLEFSLTAYNSASSPRTLTVMLWIALLGMPVVITYSSVVYWLVRGKSSEGSYQHL